MHDALKNPVIHADAVAAVDVCHADARRMYVGRCAGTLGELFQGPYWQPRTKYPTFSLVSLPVALYTDCYFLVGEFEDPNVHESRPKSARAVELFLDRYDVHLPRGAWAYESSLVTGAGMASSTADIVATLRCLYYMFGLLFDEAFVRTVLRAIERSDPVFLPYPALYLSAEQRVLRRYKARIRYHAYYVVEDKGINTEDVTEALVAFYIAQRPRYEGCLQFVRRALECGDGRALARAASLSAELSQEVLPKQSYGVFAGLLNEVAAEGMFVAHTGSIIGVLFSDEPTPGAVAQMEGRVASLGRELQTSEVGWR